MYIYNSHLVGPAGTLLFFCVEINVELIKKYLVWHFLMNTVKNTTTERPGLEIQSRYFLKLSMDWVNILLAFPCPSYLLTRVNTQLASQTTNTCPSHTHVFVGINNNDLVNQITVHSFCRISYFLKPATNTKIKPTNQHLYLFFSLFFILFIWVYLCTTLLFWYSMFN